MDLSDILFGIVVFLLFILGIGIIYAAVSYLELRSVINDCNKDMGVGNWTFVHIHDWPYDQYVCKSYKQKSFVTYSITTITNKSCYENGKEISC